MKRKTQDEAFNPVSFNVNLAQQVLGRRPAKSTPSEPSSGAVESAPTPAPAPAPAETDRGTAAHAAMKLSTKLAAKPAARKVKKAADPEPANTFRGEARQDLRIPLDEGRRDDLGDLVRGLNRKLRSRLPEAITFRALLTVMLAAEDAILAGAAANPIGRTPARQDTLAATEAERDVAAILVAALGKVNRTEVQRHYADEIARLADDDTEAPRAAA